MSPTLRLNLRSDRDYRPLEGDFVIRVALGLQVPDLGEAMPLHICLLLDNSRSMAGTKMEQAKASAQGLVNGLRDTDRLTVLAFGTNVKTLVNQTPMDEHGRRKARMAIETLEPEGVTRMDLGLVRGYGCLSETEAGSVPILLLLSDGAPTNQVGNLLPGESLEKLRSSVGEALSQNAISTSTIGLGDADQCMAPFLEQIAEQGGGVFYHESDPFRLGDRFLEELERVKGTSVKRASLHLHGDRAKLRRAAVLTPNVRQLPLNTNSEGDFVLELGTLSGGGTTEILMEVITTGVETAGTHDLFQASLICQTEGEEMASDAGCIRVTYTDDESLLHQPPRQDVETLKNSLMVFLQAQKATEQLRQNHDPKRTKALLRSAARTTKRLGFEKQTKILENIQTSMETEHPISENQLTALSLESRKTKVLAK